MSDTINISTLKSDLLAAYTALKSGIQNELPDASFVVQGQTISRDDLLTKVQGRIDAANKTNAARTALHLCVEAEHEVDQGVKPIRAAIKQLVQSRYGKDSALLQKFGFTEDRRAKRSAQSKAQAADKARATREALGTKGKKQRKNAKKALQSAPAETPAQPPQGQTPSKNA